MVRYSAMFYMDIELLHLKE